MLQRVTDSRSAFSAANALVLILLCSIVSHTTGLPAQRDISQMTDSSLHLNHQIRRISRQVQLLPASGHNNVERSRRQESSGDIQCSAASLQMIRESCELKATPTRISNQTDSLSSEIRSSFCGRNCRTLIYEYDRACGFEEFILNVSGVCTHGAEVQCISAIIISKPGIFSCLRPNIDYGVLNDRDEVESSASASDDIHCTMRSSFMTFVPYRLEAGPTGNIEISPPLESPWGVQCIHYPEIIGHRATTTTELITTQTTAEPTTTEVVTTTPLSTTSQTVSVTVSSGSHMITTPKSGATANYSRISLFVLVAGFLLSVGVL